MKYKYNLDAIKKLSEIKEDADIKQISYAQFPGTHCPLFGAIMTATYVEDLVVLVAGTEECTYYAKDFAYLRQDGNDRVFSFVTSKNDITFGCQKKLEDAILKIDREYHPKGILVLTTCVLELIGEDFESIAESLQKSVSAKLLVVRTEHFKCNSHISGVEKTLEVLSNLMEKQEKKKNTVNILGHRYSGVEDSELYKLLIKKEININMVIPSKCSMEQLRRAPEASFNIVTDFTAIKLAQKMKSDFNIDYVYFDKYLDLDRIKNAYKRLNDFLDIDITEEVENLYHSTLKKVEQSREKLIGKTFIYGNTPMMALEFSSFLCKLGMVPIWIQARELYENDEIYINEIKQYGHEPYISRIANIAPMRQVYDSFKPDYYVGHENPMELMKRNIVQLVLDEEAHGLGFEIPVKVIDKIMSLGKENMMGMSMKGYMKEHLGKHMEDHKEMLRENHMEKTKKEVV